MIKFLSSAGLEQDLLPELLEKLTQFNTLVGGDIVVTSGYRPQSDGSQHQLRKAADLMFPDASQSLIELYHVAETCGFTGIGIYPAWRLNGEKLGGLHVDIRDHQGPHAKWMGVPAGAGGQQYIALNDENLKKWGIV
jgi:uncharacterized protein YcbK (DUF882 family)